MKPSEWIIFSFQWHGPSALIGAGFVAWQFDKIPTWWFFVILLISLIRLPWLEWTYRWKRKQGPGA